MNFKKTAILTLLCFILFGVKSKAQITIGSGLAPASGALLQIKDQEASASDPKNVTATTGGFILPRVKLSNINSLAPFPITESSLYNGLMVYNVTDILPLKQGVYVWQDSKWEFVVSTEDPNLIEQ